MRTPVLLLLAFAAQPAFGQALEPLDLPPNASVAGPGPISASPTRPEPDTRHMGKHALPTRSARPLAQLLGNGTAMSYGEAGANAIGNTGGLTTGPLGSAGATAGGGGVHSGALVIPPGAVNGSMHSDESREHLAPQATPSQQP
ncbi:MAG TPA: hypothetical protein VFC24_18580 [Casimicrobiaceae bacterium]|nr:hypothetical protein [Casimicrobiaceae bacterium]